MLLEPVRRFWSAAIELEPFLRTSWGYVCTDARYPYVWDANNATVLTPSPSLQLDDVLGELRPALAEAGARTEHVEFWELGVQCPALRDARAAGTTDRADVVMAFQGAGSPALNPPVDVEVEVEVVEEPPPDFWPWYRESLNEFGTTLTDDVLDQLVDRVRRVYLPAGIRFFVGRIDRQRVGYTSLLRLEGVGYLDNVVTWPGFRRRGVASATVTAAVEASRRSGDDCMFLLAEEGGRPQGLYERLGFRVTSRIETLNRPLVWS